MVYVGTEAGLFYHRLQYHMCTSALMLDAIVAVAYVCMHFASGCEFLTLYIIFSPGTAAVWTPLLPTIPAVSWSVCNDSQMYGNKYAHKGVGVLVSLRASCDLCMRHRIVSVRQS